MVGIFIFFIRVIKNKNEHTSVVSSTLEGKMKDKENATFFAEKITEIKTIQDSINSHFVDPEKIDTFVGYLEDIGSNIGSIVVVKNIDIPQKSKNLISIKLSINGTFQNVIKTINILENIPYQVNITQIYLNKDIKDSTPIVDVKGKVIKEISVTIPTWQADVYFNILSL
jgi:hypothetical protein